jgi:hypothetical protein
MTEQERAKQIVLAKQEEASRAYNEARKAVFAAHATCMRLERFWNEVESGDLDTIQYVLEELP